MEATDSPSTSAVPAAVADPTLTAGPTPPDTPTLPVVPLSVPPDFPDTAVSSAMCLWAEDVAMPVDIARQAVRYVHAKSASELPKEKEKNNRWQLASKFGAASVTDLILSNH